MELSQVIAGELHASGGFSDAVQGISLANLGFYIIGLCLISLLASVPVYKARRIDELDVISGSQENSEFSAR